MALTQGRLRPVDGTSTEELIFQFNPSTVKRARAPVYAKVQAAFADYWSQYPTNAPAPNQWIRNPPESIQIDLFLAEDGEDDVEDDIKKIEAMMAKDARTGEPRDLLFIYGGRSDRVRIMRYEITEDQHTPELRVQQGHVRLEFETQRCRVG